MSAALSVATIVATVVLVEGRINARSEPLVQKRVEFLKDWSRSIAPTGTPLGDTGRIVKIGIFTDFQCPFCKRMDSVLTMLETKYPNAIARTVVHFPIQGHQFAKPAAIAFECAAQQGRAAQMHGVLYAEQQQFGKSPWSDFARKAKVLDVNRFDACVSQDSSNARIEAGIALGTKLAISGTPAVVVNGWLFDPAFPEAIEKAVGNVARGKTLKP